MLTIHKFQFGVSEELYIELPRGAEILKFGNQNGHPTLWVKLNTEEPERTSRKLRFFGTGHPIPTDLRLIYIGSEQFGPFVWHLFEEPY